MPHLRRKWVQTMSDVEIAAIAFVVSMITSILVSAVLWSAMKR